jgi:hypothetical protein
MLLNPSLPGRECAKTTKFMPKIGTLERNFGV